MRKQVMAVLLAAVTVTGLLSGCGSSPSSDSGGRESY